jgi:hypothetical protein
MYRPQPQSIQSARLSFQSSEVGTPPPHPQANVASPPFGSEGGDTLAGGGGDWGTQFRRYAFYCFLTNSF